MPRYPHFRATNPVLNGSLRKSIRARFDARKRQRSVFAVVLALTVLTLFAGQPSRASESPGETLKSQFDAAKAALAANQLVQAESQFHVTIALGLRQLANLSLSEQQYEQAIAYLDDAQKLQPDDFLLQLGLAVAWFQRGDQKKASEVINAALASRPNDPQAHNLMGRIFLLQNDFPRAIEELRTSLALHFDFETAYFLGVAYLKVKKMSEASDLFDKLRSTAEESSALHVIFGRAYLMANFPDPAIAEFKLAIKLNPKYPREHGLLGYAYLEHLGEQAYPQAREEFEKELKIDPQQYYFQTLLGIATVALRDFPAAEIALRKAAQLRPEEAPSYLYLGETYTETKRLKEAVEALEKYLRLVQPEQNVMREISRGYYLLGQDLLRLGRVEEAKKALQHSREYREAKFKYDQENIFGDKQAPSADGESHTSDRVEGMLEAAAPEGKQGAQALVKEGLPSAAMAQPPPEAPEERDYRAFVAEILASSYNDLGVMRAKASNFTDASAYFKQAAAWKPGLPGLDRNWGLASYRAELYSDAIAPLERQLASSPDDTFVRKLLGLSYFATDNFGKTAEVLRPFLSSPPEDPGLLFAWGTALVRTRQSETARDIFRRLLEQNASNPAVHLLLGQAYAQQEDFAGGLAELKTALQLDPRLTGAHYFMGLIHLRQSDFESAAAEFRSELELHPTDTVTTYHLGYTLLTQGHAEQAVALLREVVQAKPDYERAQFELGRALLQQGDATGAIKSLEAARKLSPDRDATYFQLSQAYRRVGRLPEAQQALTAYQKLIETNRLKRRESLEADKP
jgi:tetratricopeptide (TPR) repeat protein